MGKLPKESCEKIIERVITAHCKLLESNSDLYQSREWPQSQSEVQVAIKELERVRLKLLIELCKR